MITYRLIKPILFLLLLVIGGFCSFAQNAEKLQPRELNEVSGLVISRNNTFYVHNDSGDTSRFFAINQQGKLLATCYFKGESAKRKGVADCEDMASGPGPKKNKNYLYIGDIGDNASRRPYISVYRLPEPRKLKKTLQQLNREVVYLKYPNGAQDAEAMMVDPVLQQLIIVSKRQDTVGIYSTPIAFKDGDTVTMQKTGSLFLPGSAHSKYIVAGDISRDGKQVLLKTYDKVYYWLREGNEPLDQTLQRKPLELPYTREKQGEAIGFTPDGRGYYCISEGVNAVIYHYLLPAHP